MSGTIVALDTHISAVVTVKYNPSISEQNSEDPHAPLVLTTSCHCRGRPRSLSDIPETIVLLT